jgi:hypothetical protein
MAQASAILGGDLTVWDEWSRFLEAGGQFVLVCAAAIMVCSLTNQERVAHSNDRNLSR